MEEKSDVLVADFGKIEERVVAHTADDIARQELAAVKAQHPKAPKDVQLLVAAGNAVTRQNVLAEAYVHAHQRNIFVREAMQRAGVLPVANTHDLFGTTSIVRVLR